MTASFIAERAGRLHASCRHREDDSGFPLLAKIDLLPQEFDSIRNNVITYLYDSVSQVIPGTYKLSSDFLKDHEQQIAQLPNITPNGLLLPKKHSWLSFNMLYRAVADVVKSLKIDFMSGIHHPINVRIVNGTPNQAVDGRPRASVKTHSDIWAGELPGHAMLYFPILGDMTNNGVDLFEPGQDFFPDFVRPLDDFDEGAGLLRNAARYDIVMEPGSVYVLDAFLLHRTMKRTPGLRLVINFAYTFTEPVQSDLPINTERAVEYINPDVWYGYGIDRLLFTNNPARPFSSSEMNAVQNKYADNFDTLELRK